MIYLDNCATTKISQNVKNNIIKNIDLFGNPSSEYVIGVESKRKIEQAREYIANIIGCKKEEVYFTSGASESNSWILSNFNKCYLPTRTEHHSILNSKNIIEKYEDGCLVSQMLVNNETGLINNIDILKKKYPNSYIHTDATQAIGNINVNINELNVDSISFSGHKFHAPKGVGVLISKVPLSPLIYGGKQEFGIRGGTENILGITSLHVALKDAIDNIDKKRQHCKILKERMVYNLKNEGVDFIINHNDKNTVNSILSVAIRNIDSSSLTTLLSINDIYCSTGSACNSGSIKLSETVESLNLPDEYKNGVIRFGFSLDNTIEEIDFVTKQIKRRINNATSI